MHHPADRITHTTAFVTPAQWVHPRKDQSDDPSHHERTLLPRSYISLRYVMIQIILLHGIDVCISIVRLSSSLNKTFLSLSCPFLSNQDIIIAGDFNADGDYVGSSDWEQISLRSDRRFAWLIGDTADTTVGSTDYSYDR